MEIGLIGSKIEDFVWKFLVAPLVELNYILILNMNVLKYKILKFLDILYIAERKLLKGK